MTSAQNIFHGSMSLDQLYSLRGTKHTAAHRTPLAGLFMCGSSTHPGRTVRMRCGSRLAGGGVMGSPGRNAASIVVAQELSRRKSEARQRASAAQAKRDTIQ